MRDNLKKDVVWLGHNNILSFEWQNFKHKHINNNEDSLKKLPILAI